MAKRLFIDMDGTLARFHDEVSYLERMYEEGFFSGLKPFENMVAGINLFMEQHPDIELYTISSSIQSPFCVPEKNAWLDNHLNIPESHRIFPPMGEPKSNYIPGGITKDDFLLDDYNRGLHQFLYDGGSAIKCHNNINQQGLGAHGGSPGNFWVGHMVHTDDQPELIAAELAHCMGLEHERGNEMHNLAYDLNEVVTAYPEITITNGFSRILTNCSLQPRNDCFEAIRRKFGGPISHCQKANELDIEFFNNPLNAIRYLEGKEEFKEVYLKHMTSSFHVPVHQLKAVCNNLYGDSDYEKHRSKNPDKFAKDVLLAIAKSHLPTVGRIDFLDADGNIKSSQNFHFAEQMKKAIEHFRFLNQPVSVKWFVTPETLPFNQITNSRHLQETLQFNYNMNGQDAETIANTILTPYGERAAWQNELLLSVWNEKNLPGSMNEFLRKPAQIAKGAKSNLDSLIANASSRSNSATVKSAYETKINR